MMIMMKFRFIDSSRNKKEKEENIVETTVTKVIILKLSELLINAEVKTSLNLTKVIMKIVKQD
jgi:hypothetical protein